MSPGTTTKLPRLPSLTGLRIFAALAVYASHVGPPVGSPEVITKFMGSGYCGVTIFFVLSGVVLTLNYFGSMAKPTAGGIYDYLVARFARVYPLYLLVLLFVLVRQNSLGGEIEGWWQHVLAIQTWDPNIARAFNFNGPGWSIAVEFFLYACFPLLIPLVARLRGVPAVGLALAGVIAAMLAVAAWFALTGRADLPFSDSSSAHRWLYRMPAMRLGDFVLGILVARLFVMGGGLQAVRQIAQPLTWIAAATILAFMLWPTLFYSAWSFDVAYAVPAAALILGLSVAPHTLLSRTLSLRWIVLLGEASYAFYLIHSPGIALLGGARWGREISASIVVYEGLVLAILLALAVGLHVTIEKPARTFLRQRLSLSPRPEPAQLVSTEAPYSSVGAPPPVRQSSSD